MCVGTVNGTHIAIIAPEENPTDYFNQKGHHSIVMQAVVDHEYNFKIFMYLYISLCIDCPKRQLHFNYQLFCAPMVVENVLVA